MIRSGATLVRYLASGRLLFPFVRHCVVPSLWTNRKSRRPIFVMSSASSGSTWIAALLGHLPRHAFVHEVKLHGGHSRIFSKLLMALGPLVPGRLLFVLFEFFERARLWTLPAHAAHMGSRPELLAPENLKTLDPRAPQHEHRHYDVVDSSGSHISIAPLLRRAYPNAVLCYVVRDPRDVVLSIRYRKPFGAKQPIDYWADNYLKMYQTCKRCQASCQIDVIRYEDWLHDTEGQMRAFLDRHHLEMDDAALRAAVFQHDAAAIKSGKTAPVGNLAVAQAGNWQRQLSPEDKQVIKPILDEVLVDSGYEASTSW